MARVAISFSPEVGGTSVISVIKSFKFVGSDVVYADYRQLMRDIPVAEFERLYDTEQGRIELFAHAKFKAKAFLCGIDCLVIPGNSAMIDPTYITVRVILTEIMIFPVLLLSLHCCTWHNKKVCQFWESVVVIKPSPFMMEGNLLK